MFQTTFSGAKLYNFALKTIAKATNIILPLKTLKMRTKKRNLQQ